MFLFFKIIYFIRYYYVNRIIWLLTYKNNQKLWITSKTLIILAFNNIRVGMDIKRLEGLEISSNDGFDNGCLNYIKCTTV